MNKQIQQLADKAKKSVPHGLSPDKWIEVYNENFAKLIVQECAELATKEYNNYGGLHGNDLLEHFGIKQ